jgi:cytochrome c2
MIAGRLHTNEENLADWVQRPQEIAPGVDMPDLGVSDGDARDIAAYLLTLK